MVINTEKMAQVTVHFPESDITILRENLLGAEVTFLVTGEPLFTFVYMGEEGVPLIVTSGQDKVQIVMESNHIRMDVPEMDVPKFVHRLGTPSACIERNSSTIG